MKITRKYLRKLIVEALNESNGGKLDQAAAAQRAELEKLKADLMPSFKIIQNIAPILTSINTFYVWDMSTYDDPDQFIEGCADDDYYTEDDILSNMEEMQVIIMLAFGDASTQDYNDAFLSATPDFVWTEDHSWEASHDELKQIAREAQSTGKLPEPLMNWLRQAEEWGQNKIVRKQESDVELDLW
jgi:hypothetical protein